MNPEYDYFLKFFIAGEPKSGKSSLLLKFADDTYTESYDSTIGVDFKIRTIETSNNKTVKLQIWDTYRPLEKAKEYYINMISLNKNRPLLFILAIDLTNKDRWQERVNQLISPLNEAIKELKAHNYIKPLLVGTKCDAKRAITTIEAENFAKSVSLPYFETSAKNGINVDRTFYFTAKLGLNVIKKQAQEKERQNPIKQPIINALERYIARVESHTKKNKTNFAHGFWFFKQSRAISREANYLLAKKVLKDLLNGKSVSETFSDVAEKRCSVIAKNNLFNNPNYVSRGINSSELNNIIKNAKGIVSDSLDDQLISRNTHRRT